MRILYLDESGIGNIRNDPFLVVAGVIIHADTQYGQLRQRLDDLLSGMTPIGAKRPKYFHAKDVYHGSGDFPRETWSTIRRNSLLNAVGELVDEFLLPVPWMGIDRAEFAREQPDDTPEERLRDCYTIAATGCFLQAELYMRQLANSAEVCSCILEENKPLQKRIPEIIRVLKDPEELAKCAFDEGWERVSNDTGKWSGDDI